MCAIIVRASIHTPATIVESLTNGATNMQHHPVHPTIVTAPDSQSHLPILMARGLAFVSALLLCAAGCAHHALQTATPIPFPGPPHIYQEPTIDDIVSSGADGSVDQAKKQYGITLDYKPESIKKVDVILLKLHGQYVKDKDKSGKRWAMEGMGWGAYVGEVIQRQYGGHWQKRDNATGNPLPLIWRNKTAFPVTWCLSQIIVGDPSSSIWRKYQTITNPQSIDAEGAARKT
jgi:hypothetical protein